MQNGSTFMVVHFFICPKSILWRKNESNCCILFKRCCVWLRNSIKASIQKDADLSSLAFTFRHNVKKAVLYKEDLIILFFFQFLGPLTVLLIPFPFLLVHRSQTLQVWDSFLTCCLRVFWQWFLATKTCGFSFLFNRHNSLIKSNTTKAR